MSKASAERVSPLNLFGEMVPVSGHSRGSSRFQGCHGYVLSAYCIWPPSPLTFKAPAPKLIISDECNVLMHVNFTRVNKMEAMNGGSSVNVKVESRSTFASARGLSCIASVLLTHVKLML